MRESVKINRPILVFDSGSGGLTALNELVRVLPLERFVYFADYNNAPFGNKTKKDIKRIVLDSITALIKRFEPKAVVLACNTATACAIMDLRKKFPKCIIIGTEPAIKPAIRKYKTVLVLGTRATIRNNAIIKLFKDNVNLKFFATHRLATLIEDYYTNWDYLLPTLFNDFGEMLGKFDAVVLGCTHYVLIKNQLEKVFGNGVAILDGNSGVAKRLKSCLELVGVLQNNKKANHIKLLCTTRADRMKLKYIWNKLQGGEC